MFLTNTLLISRLKYHSLTRVKSLLFFIFLMGSYYASWAQCPVWVATEKKVVVFSPNRLKGEPYPDPVPIPVNGAQNADIKWTWTLAGTNRGQEIGITDSTKLNTTFDIQKIIQSHQDLEGTSFTLTYFITGVGKDASTGLTCQSFATIDVVILVKIHPYNAITPNSDDTNDEWFIDYLYNYPDAQIVIFDRWGQPVFESTGYQYEEKPFKGKFNGKDLPSGTYMYRITPSEEYGTIYGNLTIVR